jgi:hypothetical protein
MKQTSEDPVISPPIPRPFVVEAAETYVCWRAECAAVQDAYDHWVAQRFSDSGRAAAYADYRAALVREELAARAYMDLRRA